MPLVKTVELFGIKVELQALQEKVADATGAAESASRQASLALSVSNAPIALSALNKGPADSGDIAALANEYDEIRRTQRSGDARTAAMTDVIRRMIDLARHTESLDVVAALQSNNPGMRLFGYACLYAQPNPELLLPLVKCVTAKEDTPFGQYWGLQAIGRVISSTTSVPEEVMNKLQEMAERIPRGTDRDYEIKKLLRMTR